MYLEEPFRREKGTIDKSIVPFSCSRPPADEKSVEMALSLSKGHHSVINLRDRRTMPAWLYILRLKSGNLYIGATTDLDQRCQEHFEGKACRSTKVDPPVALVYQEEFETNVKARRREAQVKRWSGAKKEALVSGDMAKLRKLSKSRENK